MKPKRTVCHYCGEQLPENVGVTRKFCNQKCRSAFHRRLKKIQRERSAQFSKLAELPEHVQDMIYLAFGAENSDVMREVFREEIRNTISQAVKDNVLGAAEVMTQMLPKVLESLAKDVNSQDWVVRSRAQGLVLKYAMTFADKDGDSKDHGVLQVVHNVPVPATPLGERIIDAAAEREQIEAEHEAHEDEYPECQNCHQRKHPDAMYHHSDGPGRGYYWVCRTCEAFRNLAKRKTAEPVSKIKGLYD